METRTLSFKQSKFPKLNRANLSDQVMEKIRGMVASGELKQGDKLPSERELSIMFQISRLPLREALKSLQTLNVLETRVGGGYYIRGLEASNLLSFIERTTEQHFETLESWKEARITIEVAAVELACDRRTTEDIRLMRNANECMMRALAKNEEEEVLYDSMAFHNALMEASKNHFYKTILDCFKEVQYQGRRKSWEIAQRYHEAFKEHNAIIEAIVERNPDLAKQLMKRHLTTSYK